MQWVLQAVAAVALQWIADAIVTARHDRWRLRHKIPSTATRVRQFDGWLLALAVAALLYVQVMLLFFVIAVDSGGWELSVFMDFVLFGLLSGYLWIAARRHWRRLTT